MTIEQSPVTILGDLIEQLESKIDQYEISTSEALARAYAAGADQQLEQDASWLDTCALFSAHLTITPSGDALREAMRPKQTSLKEQALAELELLRGDANAHGLGFDAPAIRRALESLPD